MAKYLLSPQAEKSLIQISDYTLKKFGERQRRKYLGMLRKEMRAAAANPERGRERNEIKPGYYSVPAEKHHIYYRIGDAHIEIIDVLHQSMEPSLHL
ncbi:type II toxin-antitoxin system RelE/ParE family toxin [Algiphilus sp. W345]|uniref:Toxin n=1 Tax=Banduia mediterranea TaxID=3075609 RepID=A0ABU2WJT8_9GAMM|nr:type II toxin-antitoxin system RelE/ParE family toxin [Algiphilus sp. W345]MDT0498131.1 type II toxin-antitoxin system RelE/ParE family toxin [Algiphilus sp. W345]